MYPPTACPVDNVLAPQLTVTVRPGAALAVGVAPWFTLAADAAPWLVASAPALQIAQAPAASPPPAQTASTAIILRLAGRPLR